MPSFIIGLSSALAIDGTAIAIDPSYALAHSGLADCYSSLPSFGYVAPKDGYPKAREAAQKALELDDTLAEAHTSLAFVKAYYDWDWPGAEREMMRSIELNGASPGSRDVYAFYYLRPMGRIGEIDVW